MKTLDEFKNKLKEAVHNFKHGIAYSKKDNESINIKKGDFGIITAYLPEMEKFAIYFDDNILITFSCNEVEFLNNFYHIDCDVEYENK